MSISADSPPASASPPAAADAHQPRYRSGAVARMLRMPVATLRVWERRYRVSQPLLSETGQRLYGAADVQRLALLKQLSDLGHAIGSLARLDQAQLQQVAATHARTLAQTAGLAATEAEPALSLPGMTALGLPDLQAERSSAALPPAEPSAASRAAQATGSGAPVPPLAASAPALRPGNPRPRQGAAAAQPWRVLVVGKLLGQRLQGGVKQALTPQGRLLHLIGPFETLEEAAAQPLAGTADALLVYAASLHEEWLDRLFEQLPGLRHRPLAVLYGFASERSCRLLSRTPGLSLLRGPQSDAALAQWLRGWRQQAEADAHRPGAGADRPGDRLSQLPVPARRWDDEALASFAGLSTTIACECPRHLADLLVMLSHFEAYSADCEHRSPEDAELHAYLRQITGLARAQFETALEKVARHEGLLPG